MTKSTKIPAGLKKAVKAKVMVEKVKSKVAAGPGSASGGNPNKKRKPTYGC